MNEMVIKKVDAPYVVDMNPAGPFDCAAAINAAIAAQAAAEAAQAAAEAAGALDPTLVALSHLDGSLGLVEQIGDDMFAKRPLGVAAPTHVPTVADGDLRWMTRSNSLTALVPLNPVANTLAYYTGSTTAALTPITAFGRSLLAAVDAPALGPIIGLGTAAYEDLGIIGATIPLLSNANTWGARQDIHVAHAGVAFQIYSSDSGALDGPVMALSRDSTSPQAGDLLGSLYAYGRTVSGDLAALYSTITTQIVSAADTPNFAGRVIISTAVAGSSVPLAAASFENTSVVIGSAAGGNKGDSSLNAKLLYEGGVAISAKYGVLAGTNLWTAVNTFRAGSVHGGATTPGRAATFSNDGVLSLRYGNNAIVIPLNIINQNPPAATAYQAGIQFSHGAGEFIGSRIVSIPLTDFATQATSQATLNLQYTNASGVLANGLVVGLGVAVGTVGLMGVNTLNAFSIYENSVLLTSKYGQLAVNNNWSGVQTVTVAAGGTMQQWVGTNDNTTATQLLLRHARATPTNADPLGIIYFQGNNSALSNFNFALFGANALAVAAGAESGQFTFTTYSAGVAAVRMDIRAGVLFGNPSGGDKGTGTINVQNGIYENNVLISTKYVIGLLSTDGTLSANLDTNVPSQKAVKTYVDTVVAGFHYTDSVRVATTAAGTLASSFENGDTVDGVVLATGNRILIKDQAAQTENGIYIVNASGAPTRATDADTGAELKGIACLVTAGTVNINSQWSNSNTTTITIGTTNVTFAQIGAGATAYAAGFGLSLTGVTFAVADPELVALAGLTSAPDQVPYFTGSGAAALMTATSFSRGLLANSTQGAWQTALGLAIGSNVQAYDATLAGLAAMPGTVGLLAQTSADVFGIRLIGVANATDIPDRASGDGRWLPQTSYTAADVLSKLLTVDGTGSLLDADFLDGQSGAYYNAWANLTGVPGTFAPSAHTHPWSDITATPTTLAGYGITDAAPLVHTHTFASLTSKPTTLAGYGITDAAPIASPTFTGIPAGPTAAPGTNTTQLATTAFVTGAITTAGGGYQPLDSDLTAIAALTTQTFGRSLLTAASDTAARSLLLLGTAALQNIGTSGATVPLLSTANTWSTTQTITATNPTAVLNKSASGGLAALTFQTAGNNRWSLASNQTAESGSNAGSDLDLKAYNDAGTTLLSTPISIKRSTGVVDFAQVPTVGGIPMVAGFLYASAEGIIEDDGVTDMTTQLEAAFLKAATQGKVLVLDRKKIRSSRGAQFSVVVPTFATLSVISFINTQIILTTRSTFGVITGTQISSGPTVKWNYGSGYAQIDEAPYTTLAENCDRGWHCKLSNVAAVLPGHLIKIQTKQLPVSEHRFSDSVGELNKIIAVNPDGTIEVETKLRHNYRIGNLHTTTVAAVTTNSITLTAAPPAGVTPERLCIKLPDGSERFAQWYDSATKTLSWPLGGRWDQNPYLTTTVGQVRVATLVNGNLATAFANGQTVDGVVLATGNRILIKNQTAAKENGIYTVNASGAPTRATISDTGAELMTFTGGTAYVTAGTQAGTQWRCSNTTTPVVGTDAITFAAVDKTGILPAVGATVTLSADPYVFIFAPIHVNLKGWSIVSADVNSSHGLGIQMGDGIRLEDFGIDNCSNWGLNLTYCYEPEVRFSQGDRSNYNSLGYTTLWSECRGGLNIGYRSHNNRRMSDSGRICQSIGLLVTDFQVNGGWKNDLGQEWEFEGPFTTENPEEYNYGIGGHGQVLDWTWQNGVVRDVKIGWIARGSGERLRNVVFEGYMSVICNWGAGDNRSVMGASFDDLVKDYDFPDSVNNAHYVKSDRPVFAAIPAWKFASYPYLGPAEFMDINCKGLKHLFVFDTGGETELELPGWVFQNIVWRTMRNAGNCAVVATADGDELGLRDCTLRDITIDNRSNGLIGELGGPVIALNSWMRVGTENYRFRIADGGLVKIPIRENHSNIVPGSILRARITPTAPLGGVWFGDILLSNSGLIGEAGVCQNVKGVSQSAMTGGSDPAGSLNVAWVDTDAVWVRNRLGAEAWGVIEALT